MNVPIKIRIRVNRLSLAVLLVSLVGLCLLSPLAWQWAEAQLYSQPEALIDATMPDAENLVSFDCSFFFLFSPFYGYHIASMRVNL